MGFAIDRTHALKNVGEEEIFEGKKRKVAGKYIVRSVKEKSWDCHIIRMQGQGIPKKIRLK